MTATLEERASTVTAVLQTEDAEDVLAAIERLVPDADVRELARAALRALRGSRPAVRDYVERYQTLNHDLLLEAATVRPDVVTRSADGTFTTPDEDGRPTTATIAVLDTGALSAPFSTWISSHGAEHGLLLHTVSSLRAALPHAAAPLFLSHGNIPHYDDVDAAAISTFVASVQRELIRPTSSLDAIAETFGLNETELARLFGVRRQAIAQWRSGTIPGSRADKVASVASLADVLARKLKAERLPGIARRGAEAYGGLSMLEMIAADRHDELLSTVRDSFDPSMTA